MKLAFDQRFSPDIGEELFVIGCRSDIVLNKASEFVVISGMCKSRFGIGFIEEDVVMYAAPDVTRDRDLAVRLVRLFNEHQLSPIHIYDVLEDMLTE